MRTKTKWIFLSLILVPFLTHAQSEVEEQEIDQAASNIHHKVKVQPTFHDFEAEVIQGERKSPNIFVQMEIDTPNLDSVMFRRKNFNDFHLLEVDRKPLYKKPD